MCFLGDWVMVDVVGSRKPPIGSHRFVYPLTECGNAERFVDQHGDCVRYCAVKRQWLVWNGIKWAADEGAAMQLVKKTVRAMRVEHKQVLADSECDAGDWESARRQAEALARWANRSESAAQISATLRLAQSDPRVTVDPGEFDRSPWLLNLSNGCVDLRSGKLREHRAEDLLTKIAGAEYQSRARCPRWKRFLSEIFKPYPDIIPYLQKAIGYALTGETYEECVFVLLGSGRNGKSTLIGVIHELVGDYGGVAEMDTFLAGGSSYLREDLADMRGRRFVSAQEPLLSGRFAEATLKWVSGGDKLRARRLYEHAQEFQPTHKLWLAMNRLPALRSDDEAAWSRLRVIPFEVSFAGREDTDLKAELRTETNGILKWALEGCLLWQRDGLAAVASIRDSTGLWRGHPRESNEAA
jgi:putative DNA primase/helicase